MNKLYSLLLLVVGALLSSSGCTTTATDKGSQGLTADTNTGEPAASATMVIPQPMRGNSETALLYNLLVAEIAGGRDQPIIAAVHYIAAVEQNPDIALAERATQVSLYSRNYELAKTAATLWVELEPERVEPRQVLAAVYIQQDNLPAAREHLMALLQISDLSSSKDYLSLAQFFATKEDQQAMLTVLEEIAAARPEDSEAQYAAAMMAIRFTDYSKALQYTTVTVELRPDWSDAVIVHAQVLALNEQPDAGVASLQAYSAKHPQQKQVHYALARMLIDADRPSAAREEFDRIHQSDPDNAEVLFALGLLNMQLGDLPTATTHLLALQKKGYQENRVHYYLGKLAEQQGDPEQAIHWYSTISDEDYRVEAAARMAYLTAQLGDIEKALTLLEQTNATRDAEKLQLAVIKCDILVHAGRFEDAIATATTALATFPDNVSLLFSRSNAYERVQKYDAMENDVNTILAIHPDNANALNALGYSLADRGIRLPEAHELLSKALRLDPDNPYILDSMGWVEYRLGNYDKALPLLRKALAIMPDGEVYAHLAITLIATGAEQEARELLARGQVSLPGNAEIEKVLSSMNAVTVN